MTPEIERIVERVLAEHPSGQAFFTALDAELRKPDVFGMAYSEAHAMWLPEFGETPGRYVVSGKFGEAFRDWRWSLGKNDVLVVEGDLRHDGLTPIGKDRVKHSEPFIFIDDTIYRGRTMKQVKKMIDWAGGQVLQSVIIYDGAHEPFDAVRSLYRWRDRRKPEESNPRDRLRSASR